MPARKPRKANRSSAKRPNAVASPETAGQTAWRDRLDEVSNGFVGNVWGTALLGYPRERCGVLGRADLRAIKEAIERANPVLFREFEFAGGRGQQAEARAKDLQDQGVALLRGLLHGIRAAHYGATEQINQFAAAAWDAIECYRKAWPLADETVEPHQICGNPFVASELSPRIEPGIGRLAEVCHRDKRSVHLTSWLALRRLLTYLTEPGANRSGTPLARENDHLLFETQASVLFDREDGNGGGHVATLDIRTHRTSFLGYYLDPASFGLTVLDADLLRSLRDAWSRTEQALRAQRTGLAGAWPTVRLSLRVPAGVPCLHGGSAGVLLACGMYAAARRLELDTDASASVAFDARDSTRLAPVAEDSIEPKLQAAASHQPPLRRVVLCGVPQPEKPYSGTSQADRAQMVAERLGLGVRIHAARTLEDAFQALTGNAEMQRVLDEFCNGVVSAWSEARHNTRPPDRLHYYVDPHYSVLIGDDPRDTTTRRDTGGEARAEERGQRFEAVADEHDDAETELRKLLEKSRRLVITEDAGAGKSIFTRRLQAYLCSRAGQDAFFHGKSCLAVRWEPHKDSWPEDFKNETKLLAKLAEAVKPICEKRHGEAQAEQVAAEVAAWALKHDHVVLILDAFDQVPEQPASRLDSFFESQHSGPLKHHDCRIIVTSRTKRVGDYRTRFDAAGGWVHGCIEGFDVTQQYEYLSRGPQSLITPLPADRVHDPKRDIEQACQQQIEQSRLFPPYREVAELLRIPVVLLMIRDLAEAGQLRPFRTRGDLYLQFHAKLMQRAAKHPNLRADSSAQQRWTDILAALAFEMMCDDQCVYEYAADKVFTVARIVEGARRRIPAVSDEDWREQWKQVLELGLATDRQIFDLISEANLSWKHKGMMEFYCGLHLARNSQANWVSTGRDGNRSCIACGDSDARRFASHEGWNWAWRFAIEIASNEENRSRWSDTLSASLSALFECPEKERGLAQANPRPTELMFRASEVLDKLPRGKEVIARFQSEFDAMRDDPTHAGHAVAQRIVTGFVRCPKDPKDDRKSFDMGSPKTEAEGSDNELQHRVIVSPFEMAKYAVTNAQYELFDKSHNARRWGYPPGSKKHPDHEKHHEDGCHGDDDYPVVNVSWYDAWAFSVWLGANYALPTEAQWEYACRAQRPGQKPVRFAFGDELSSQQANFGGNLGHTTRVGSYPANDWELLDMHGNVWEWCWDWFDETYYEGSSEHDPTGPDSGTSRVLRGGSWGDDGWNCRSASRDWFRPVDRDYIMGFRVVRALLREDS